MRLVAAQVDDLLVVVGRHREHDAMDADSQLSPDWIRSAVAALSYSRHIGGVCGTYLGERAAGLIC